MQDAQTRAAQEAGMNAPRESNEQHTIGGILARLADACQCEPDIGLFYCGACKDAEVIERTLAELLEYARHYARCPRTADLWDANASQIVRAEERKCECGLDALLARLDGKEQPR